jgi:hypothetical protein
VTDWLEGNSFAVTLPLFAIMTLAVFSLNAPTLKAHPDEIFISVGLVMALCALLSLIGLAVLWFSPVTDRIASAGSLGWLNDVLVIVVAIQLGQPTSALLAALYEFPFFLLIIPFIWMRHRARKEPSLERGFPPTPS